MLEIDMEFRKGILFVRLNGHLIEKTVDTLNKEVTNIVKEYGISNVVFNVTGLESIDIKGIESLISHKQLTKDYHGLAMICGMDDAMPVKKQLKKNKVFNYLYEISDELTAIEKVNN